MGHTLNRCTGTLLYVFKTAIYVVFLMLICVIVILFMYIQFVGVCVSVLLCGQDTLISQELGKAFRNNISLSP